MLFSSLDIDGPVVLVRQILEAHPVHKVTVKAVVY